MGMVYAVGHFTVLNCSRCEFSWGATRTTPSGPRAIADGNSHAIRHRQPCLRPLDRVMGEGHAGTGPCSSWRRPRALTGGGVYSSPVADIPDPASAPGRDTDVRLTRAPGPRALTDSRVFLVLGLWAALLSATQLARRCYIDPGSGSFAIQIIIAAVLGGILTARLWLRHVFWRILGRGRRKKPSDQPAGEETDR